MKSSTEPLITESYLRHLLATENFSYQRIELPYDLVTRGQDRSGTARIILPEDMTGKSVLDVGCSYGYFCFEALRRGASAAVGVDADPEAIRKARLLAHCLRLPADFRLLDIDTEVLEEQFDYVLCLNVLHHTRNPIGVLDKLADATKERLVLEMAGTGRHDRKKLGLPWSVSRRLDRYPLLCMEPSKGSTGFKGYFLTPVATKALLKRGPNAFAQVNISKSDFKDRYLATGDKKRMKKLVVVAGPTSVGKSHFVDALLRGGFPDIRQLIGMNDPSGWRMISAKSVRDGFFPTDDLQGVVFHYDFLRPYRRTTKTHDRDDALGILAQAESILFLTLVAPPAILRQRIEESELRPRRFGRPLQGNKRHLLLRQDYEHPQRVRGFYETWFSYADKWPGEHILLSCGDEFGWSRLDQWTEMAKANGLDVSAIPNDLLA